MNLSRNTTFALQRPYKIYMMETLISTGNRLYALAILFLLALLILGTDAVQQGESSTNKSLLDILSPERQVTVDCWDCCDFCWEYITCAPPEPCPTTPEPTTSEPCWECPTCAPIEPCPTSPQPTTPEPCWECPTCPPPEPPCPTTTEPPACPTPPEPTTCPGCPTSEPCPTCEPCTIPTSPTTTPRPTCPPPPASSPKFSKVIYQSSLPSWPIAGTTIHLEIEATTEDGAPLRYQLLTSFEFLALSSTNDIIFTSNVSDGAFVGPNNVMVIEVVATVIGDESRSSSSVIIIVFPRSSATEEQNITV